MKKIMFIIPTLCGGGAEKTVANLSKYLINDYEVEIVAFRDTDVKYSYAGNLTFLSNKKASNIIEKLMFFMKSIKKLKKIKKEKKIDYAISFLTTADILNVFSKVKGTKTLISIRNTDSIYTDKKLYKIMTKISCMKCDHIVSISNQVKSDLIKNFNISDTKITTIYNPALKIEFGTSNIKLKEDFFNDFVVINVGRLTTQKGQWHLIRAFSRVVKRCPTAKLLILGQGELEQKLVKLVKDYSLEDNIYLLGFVDNPYDYIKRANCFVFSSLYEGLGNALLESLACGTPIISTDCISGPREILAPNTDFNIKVKDKIDYAEFGILVPVGDGKVRTAKEELIMEEKVMADAIIKLASNSQLLKKYQKKTLERKNYFDIETIKQQWVELLEKEVC